MERKISDQLRAYREAAGLTQEDLAKKTGIAIGSISDWERGVRTPTIQKIIALAGALGASVDQLVSVSPAQHGQEPTESEVMRLVIRATHILEEASKKAPEEGARDMLKALGVLQIVTESDHPPA